MPCENTVEINGRVYIAADSIRPESKAGDRGVCIVIGQRGFVWVGHLFIDGDNARIEKAANIRIWGTTKGLGELVNGPTASTKLDECGVVRLHPLAIIATIDCNHSKWADRI